MANANYPLLAEPRREADVANCALRVHSRPVAATRDALRDALGMAEGVLALTLERPSSPRIWAYKFYPCGSRDVRGDVQR